MTKSTAGNPQKSNRLLSTVSSARWSPFERDGLASMLTKMQRMPPRITTMPPSPALKSSSIVARTTFSPELQMNVIAGDVKLEPSKIGLQLMRDLPMDQIAHRSRVETTASSLTQVNEIKKRLNASKDAELQSVIAEYAMDADVSEATFQITRKAIAKRLRFDPVYIAKYVNDHKLSSVNPGTKWSELPDVTDPANHDWWKEFFEHIRHIFTIVLADQNKDFPQFDYGLGGRARPEVETMRNTWDYPFITTRSRIVLFHPAMSSGFVFLPEKTEMYEEVHSEVSKLLNLPPIWYPPIHGGKVYRVWAEARDCIINLGDDWNVKKNGVNYAWDGKNWEQFVPRLLGASWNAVMVMFGGELALPSGSVFTTLAGSIAMWDLASKLMRDGVEEIPGLFERQPADEDAKFMLGLRYKEDWYQPRLQGLKLSVDDAKKSVNLKAGVPLYQEPKYHEQEQMAWMLAYYGLNMDGDSILDNFAEVPAGDFISPNALIEKLILTPS